MVNLDSPDEDRGVPAPGDDHRAVGGDIHSSDFSSMTISSREQELAGACAPRTQAPIPKMKRYPDAKGEIIHTFPQTQPCLLPRQTLKHHHYALAGHG